MSILVGVLAAFLDNLIPLAAVAAAGYWFLPVSVSRLIWPRPTRKVVQR